MKDIKNKILIVEDSKNIAQMLKRGLEEKGFEADIAPDGYIGIKKATEQKYDAVILDIKLPLVNGYEVCKEIRKTDARIPIIMLTAYGSMENKLAGFDLGADDYITKPFELKELMARLKVCLKRGKEISQTSFIYKIADLELNCQTKIVTRAGINISLTAKEYLLLEFFMKNQNRVISRAELSENIWEISFDTGTNIVEVYMNYLRNKIDKDFSPKLIHTSIGLGYIMKED